MSIKLPKRLSSKKKKHPKDNAHVEALNKLGLDDVWTKPLDPAFMLDISTWTVENQAPLEIKDLPNAFLQRLWLLSPDARNSSCNPQQEASTEDMNNGAAESQYAINPLDLVTAVYMSANTFLQQEITLHMVKCQFAVPLVLPNIDPEEPGRFLLWPLRGVVSHWRSDFINRQIHLASANMPMISFVKLGLCGVSKSQVLNNVIRSSNDTFLHRGLDGGELPRRLSNGLVEIAWYLPTGDAATNIFPVPVVISNLRGNAGTHEKYFSLLCQVSSAVVVFCGNLKEEDKKLLISCKNKASNLILINVSNPEKNENRVVGFVDQNLEEGLGLPGGSILQGGALSEEELASRLCDTLKDLFPDNVKLVTLEAVAELAEELGLIVDEAVTCKKSMAKVDEVLNGLDEGSVQFREKQLPLQGALWSKLAEIEKKERKHTKEGKETDPQLQKQKKDILEELRSYKLTPAMKIFINALFTRDTMERTFFLIWMKVKLQMTQTEKQNSQHENKDGTHEHFDELENGANYDMEDSDSFCTDSTFEEEQTEDQSANTERQDSKQQSDTVIELELILQDSTEKTKEPLSQQEKNCTSTHDPSATEQQFYVTSNGSLSTQGKQLDEQELTPPKSDSTSSLKQIMSLDHSFEHQTCSQPFEHDPSLLSLEHFLREMGLIFELTHISPGSGSQNVLRLPSLATELLLYGVPIELMDGDASNIPIHWLGCVFAELKRRLPQEQCRIRVLTNLGVHHARNAEVLSALFGVRFPEIRSTKGIYMLILCLPENLKKDMECDFLLLIDVEGLCLDKERNMPIHDNEMATVATGLSDILMQNISPHMGAEFETHLSVIVSALLRIKECGSMPICQFLTQDDGLNSVLQASQLKHVSAMLQNETSHTNDPCALGPISINFVKGPWHNISLSEPVDMQYSKEVLRLKQKIFGTLKKCTAKSDTNGLSDFMGRLSVVWDAVRSESFSVSLQDTDTALAFSLMCTEVSQWENCFLQHMESWLTGTTKTIFAPKAKTLDTVLQNGLLSGLKDEAKKEVKTEVDKLRSKVEAYLMKDDSLKMITFKHVILSNMDNLQEQVTEEIIQRLDVLNESYCSSTQMKIFVTLLEQEQKSKLHALIENNKMTKILLQDAELEEEFEGLWSQLLSNFDFRPSETDDITTRVTDVLKKNIIKRGLQKHMKKIEDMGQNQMPHFCIYDNHFGYRSRLKHMFDDNNRLQKLEAQQLACNIIEEYNQFVAEKSGSPADFSDNYITELLENIERALKEKSMDIRSAFEVELKVFLCNAACQDFQKVHDRYAKDREFLESISEMKCMYLAEFIYQFRKRDQCRRMAQAFTNMVIKPTVLNYIYKPLGLRITEEIQRTAPQYQSQNAFHQSLLEDLIREDCFENFLEYLHSYDEFRLRKAKETVLTHLSESTNLNKWRQQRLGEIVGIIAAAFSETAEGTSGVLSDAKPLLERLCLTLERDGDVDVTWAALDGPLFGITMQWDYFVMCLMELLAEMRLEMAQEFLENVEITKILQCLPIQPHNSLFKRVRGCDQQCPVCGAPCELEEMGHEVHQAVLHRPRGMMPNKSWFRSGISFPESMTKDNPDQCKDTVGMSAACKDLHCPDWNSSSEEPNIQNPSAYWRYVLVRFNERFAKEYKQGPAEIPEEWKNITEKEALHSLKEAFSAHY